MTCRCGHSLATHRKPSSSARSKARRRQLTPPTARPCRACDCRAFVNATLDTRTHHRRTNR